MTVRTTRQVLKVFLASPDDVTAERTVAEEVVNALNKVIGDRLGLQIALYKWEDAKPGAGRPQSIINAAVDDCDLFIGLLYERWGRPTGDYSSGFHEEFDRAKKRWRIGGEPEIWLTFKAPRPGLLDDPGDHLKRIIEFREREKVLGEVLFKEVKDTADWKSKLYEWLLAHALDLAPRFASPVLPRIAASSPEAPVPSSSSPAGSDEGAAIENEVLGQLAKVSGSMARVVLSGNLEFSVDDANILTEFEIARLYLLSATWIGKRYTGDFLGVHEVNLIYKYRADLRPTIDELDQLFRTALHDAGDVVPGWYWFSRHISGHAKEMLLAIADENSDAQLRVRALRMLRLAKIEIKAEGWTSLPLFDDSDSVRLEALEYLGSMADESAVPILEEIVSAETDSSVAGSAAVDAMSRIFARYDPKRALLGLASGRQIASAELLSALKHSVKALDETGLLKAAEDPIEGVRAFAVAELAQRNKLPMSLARTLIADPSDEIKEIAFLALAREGEQIELEKVSEAFQGSHHYLGGRPNPTETVVREVYRKYSTEQVEREVDWYSVRGPIAYKALALDRAQEVLGDVRSDLASDFERVRERSLARILTEIGVENVDRFVERWKDLEKYIRSTFTAAALSGLAAHAELSDAEVARKFLNDADIEIQLASVQIISQFGEERDVSALLGIAKERWGLTKTVAASGALKLSPRPFDVASELMRTDDSELAKIAFEWLDAHDSEELRHFLKGLLAHENEVYRLRAVYWLSKRLGIDELRELLGDYLTRGKYYYNVVTWRDRMVYAPSPLVEMYSQELVTQF